MYLKSPVINLCVPFNSPISRISCSSCLFCCWSFVGLLYTHPTRVSSPSFSLMFIHRYSLYVVFMLISRACRLHMCVCYLPPENSSRGNESHEFLDNMLSQIYVHHNPLIPLVICGDFNARLGEKQDYSDSADTVLKWIIMDTTLNRYGHHILDFLNDSCCCILNGRGDPKLDNYTSVSPRGRAVVDYMIVPRDQLSLFSEFQFQTVSDLVNQHRLTPSSRMPDHSVLKCALCLTPWSSIMPKLPSHCVTGSVDQPTQTSRRYKLEGGENIANMFNSPRCITALMRITRFWKFTHVVSH